MRPLTIDLAERLVTPGGSVLVLAASEARLESTIDEWFSVSTRPLRILVARLREARRPVAVRTTTDWAQVLAHVVDRDFATDHEIAVVFAAYDALELVHRAQRAGLPPFDLVLCVDVHRSGGGSLLGRIRALERVDADLVVHVRWKSRVLHVVD